MSRLYILILIVLLYGCSQKGDKDYLNNSKLVVKNLSDSLYQDFDFFTFEPKGKISKKIDAYQTYLTFEKYSDSVKFRIVISNKSHDIIIKKNKNGLYSYLQSENQDYIKEFLYTVFLEDKIFTFILNRKGDEDKFTLTSYRLLFPIDSKKMEQRELIYKLEKNVYINDFDSINVNNYLNVINDFESEYIYRFNYNKQICFKYYKDENNKMILESKYEIFNSESVASPFYFFWNQIR